MKYLGKVDDIIFNGRIIVRTTFKPRFGDVIVDKHKNLIGKVSQVIGPVREPFIIISPNRNVKTSFRLIGTDIYIK